MFSKNFPPATANKPSIPIFKLELSALAISIPIPPNIATVAIPLIAEVRFSLRASAKPFGSLSLFIKLLYHNYRTIVKYETSQ